MDFPCCVSPLSGYGDIIAQVDFAITTSVVEIQGNEKLNSITRATGYPQTARINVVSVKSILTHMSQKESRSSSHYC